MSNVLFLSTDGLTDQLGQSQILPYLTGLRAKGHNISIISLEKPERQSEIEATKQFVIAKNITWFPLTYHNKPPIVSTLSDLRAMYKLACRIVKEHKVEIVHCRSYLAALVGLRLKNKFNTKLLFDTRGFWIDERIEGKIWNPKNPVYAAVIKWLRIQEKRLYKNSDAVVMLTEASKKYLQNHTALNPATPLVEVIPCCTDENVFTPLAKPNPERASIATQLGIAQYDMIVIYHGSLGTWYKLDELVDFFIELNKKFPEARLLVVTRDATNSLRTKWMSTGLADDKLLTFSATRAQMPAVLSLAQLAVFFIKPSFSKMASSPTKMGELCFMQIPFVTNSGVGDVDALVSKTSTGLLVKDFTLQAYQNAVDQIDDDFLSSQSSAEILNYFSLQRGVEKYHSLYRALAKA